MTEIDTQKVRDMLVDYCKQMDSCGSCVLKEVRKIHNDLVAYCGNIGSCLECSLNNEVVLPSTNDVISHPIDNPITHPAHYTDGKIEVWDFIADKNLDYFLGNVIKYVCRAGKKDPDKRIEDLKKARAYIDKQIELWESESNVKV